MGTGLPVYKEVHLGQEVFLILWDDDTGHAGVARAEVVQYASDWSKVRVKVVDAPQLNVIGRTTWVLPDRLDDDPLLARRNYHRRAREEMRLELAEARHTGGRAETGGEGARLEPSEQSPEQRADGSEALRSLWRPIVEAWADVDLLVDSIDFESGWPENQARLAKFATIALLHLEPKLRDLLDRLPAGEPVEAVRAGLQGGILGAVRSLCANDPCGLLTRWDEAPLAEVTATADYLTGLRGALEALAEAHSLDPRLGD